MKKNYIDYDAIAFAEDTTFIKWVRHQNPEAKLFWEDWVKSHPDKATAIKEAKVLVQALNIQEAEPSKERIDMLWSKIDAATTEQSKTSNLKTVARNPQSAARKPQIVRWLSYAAAACIAGLLFFYLQDPSTMVEIGKGEHLAYTLPDASTIQLNADSKISFKEKSWSKERIVKLEGEAFFEVKKGQTFKVITPLGEVEVLGTSFNVNTRNGSLVVDCQTGKVRVSAKGDQKILTPGQGTRLNKEQTELVDTYTSNINQRIGWRRNQFHFDNTNFRQVVEEMERQYDTSIQVLDKELLDKVGAYTFEGNLETALKEVCYQLNAKYTIKEHSVVIEKK